MRYLAKPELKQRLIQVNGSEHGYIHRLRGAMAAHHREAELPSINFLWRVINADTTHKPTPAWQVVEFVRFAERNPDMPYLEAFEIAERWFDLEVPTTQKKAGGE